MQHSSLAVYSYPDQQTGQTKSVNDFIFNADNLMDYEVGALQSLTMVHKAMRKATRPFSGISPQELARQVNQIDLAQPAGNLETALAEVESIYLNNAVYFHHPGYVAHLNCPVAYPAVLAEQILSGINTSVDTWDQSGGATLIEQKLIDWTSQQIGFDDNADGIFTSGGTQSNLMGMLVAREQAVAKHAPDHDVRYQGLPAVARRFRIFTSAMSHFSIQKAASLLGLGFDAVVPVPVDDHFKMDMHALAQALNEARDQGLIPICINVTAGTTDYGSIDDITGAHQLARQFSCWLHVDAAYGGGLLLSDQHRYKLTGIASADSVTLDYHKSLMQPVSSSGFMLKDRAFFKHITLHSDYLNPLAEKGQGYPNLVDKSLQTTRRFDALKLWMTLRTMGAASLGQGMDKIIALARQCYLVLKTSEVFEVVNEPELSAIVFRYAPAGIDDATLNTVNQAIRQHFLTTGEAMIARTTLHGNHYLKFTLLNPATRIDTLQQILSRISELGDANLATLASQAEEKQ